MLALRLFHYPGEQRGDRLDARRQTHAEDALGGLLKRRDQRSFNASRNIPIDVGTITERMMNEFRLAHAPSSGQHRKPA